MPTDREPDHVMKMTIASLTTLLLGYKTASKLYEMARIETTPQTVESWMTCSSTIFHMFRTIFNLFYALQKRDSRERNPSFSM